MEDEGEDVVGFNLADAEALVAMIGGEPPVRRSVDTYDATRLVVAYTTAGATARSGTTLGTGTATIYYIAVSGADRVLTSTSDTTPFYNMSTTAVAATKYLMLLRHGDIFLANWEEC